MRTRKTKTPEPAPPAPARSGNHKRDIPAETRAAANAPRSKYSFRAYGYGGNKMLMKLTVIVPNSPGSTDYHLVSGGRFEEWVSLSDPEGVVEAIRRAFAGELGGRVNPLKKPR